MVLIEAVLDIDSVGVLHICKTGDNILRDINTGENAVQGVVVEINLLLIEVSVDREV